MSIQQIYIQLSFFVQSSICIVGHVYQVLSHLATALCHLACPSHGALPPSLSQPRRSATQPVLATPLCHLACPQPRRSATQPVLATALCHLACPSHAVLPPSLSQPQRSPPSQSQPRHSATQPVLATTLSHQARTCRFECRALIGQAWTIKVTALSTNIN